MRVFGVRPYQPSARRVYQPAALPYRDVRVLSLPTSGRRRDNPGKFTERLYISPLAVPLPRYLRLADPKGHDARRGDSEDARRREVVVHVQVAGGITGQPIAATAIERVAAAVA
jgi:hypothetical protein